MHHDITETATPFPNNPVGDYDVNPNDPGSNTYSIGNSLSLFVGSTGLYHFKLCYKEVFPDLECIEWQQSNNPFTGAARADYNFIWVEVEIKNLLQNYKVFLCISFRGPVICGLAENIHSLV